MVFLPTTLSNLHRNGWFTTFYNDLLSTCVCLQLLPAIWQQLSVWEFKRYRWWIQTYMITCYYTMLLYDYNWLYIYAIICCMTLQRWLQLYVSSDLAYQFLGLACLASGLTFLKRCCARLTRKSMEELWGENIRESLLSLLGCFHHGDSWSMCTNPNKATNRRSCHPKDTGKCWQTSQIVRWVGALEIEVLITGNRSIFRFGQASKHCILLHYFTIATSRKWPRTLFCCVLETAFLHLYT